MSNIFTIKRGATFSETFTVTNTDGTVANLSAAAMSCEIRDPEDVLVATLTPVATGVAGQAQLFVQDTSAWPEALLRADIEVTQPGGAQVIFPTFGILVEHAETQSLPAQPAYNPVTAGQVLPPVYGEDGL